MQVKNQICTERRSTDEPEQDENQKKTSCFSNIKIFLVSECALMLAQGTVGAYLVSTSSSDAQPHFFPTILVRSRPPAAAGRPQIDDGLRVLHQADAHSASARHARCCWRTFGCAQLLERVMKRWTCAPLTPQGRTSQAVPDSRTFAD